MKKVKVIEEYLDRECDLVHRYVDDELELEDARAKELIDGGYVEEIKPSKKTKK